MMMNYLDFAKDFLTKVGAFDSKVYWWLIWESVMELCQKFSDQNHSWHSASIVLGIFEELNNKFMYSNKDSTDILPTQTQWSSAQQ